MINSAILTTAYASPVQYFSKLLAFDKVLIEVHENYNKQSYRTRCQILSANGPLFLSIPVQKGEQIKCNIRKVRIDYSKRWQAIHWKAIESAYRSSPFFIYYADDIKPFYENQEFQLLYDFNTSFQASICKLLDLKVSIVETQQYKTEYSETLDYRNLIHPKKNITDNMFSPKPYFQVFENKFKFVPNLSILDLLFNMGPESKDVLKSSVYP